MTNDSLSSENNEEHRARLVAAAADWLVVQDRGPTAAEAQELALWLTDPAHAEIWAEAQQTWKRLDRLPELSPSTTAASSPHRLWRWPVCATAAAAVIIAGWMQWQRPTATAPTAPGIVRVMPKQLMLSDGSRVDLNADSEVEEQFTPAERRVRLVRGEAHFAVTKNPERPFVVVAGGMGVRAVGTAFNVRLDAGAIDVLVTEGCVQLASRTDGAGGALVENSEKSARPQETPGSFAAPPPALLNAGERAIVGLTATATAAKIGRVSTEEIARLLAWQGLRLQFHDVPLDKVAAEFNRHNATHLIVGDSAADILVAGSFRADNVDVFVRFMEEGFQLKAERRSDGTVLLHKAE